MRTVNFQLMLPGATIKKLIIVHVVIWALFQVLLEGLILDTRYVTIYFGMVPKLIIESFFGWQFLTYMFLHATNPFHILFNMMGLWFFGSELEMRWGSRLFLTFYLFCGVAAGFFYVFGLALYGLVKGAEPMAYMTPVVGASGAVFGVLLAYAVLFGERMIYFFGVFPMKARVFVAVIALIELATLIGDRDSGVANLAHLGGLVAGALFLFGWTRLQQIRWRKNSATRRNLKLVVNKDDSGDGPRFWN